MFKFYVKDVYVSMYKKYEYLIELEALDLYRVIPVQYLVALQWFIECYNTLPLVLMPDISSACDIITITNERMIQYEKSWYFYISTGRLIRKYRFNTTFI